MYNLVNLQLFTCLNTVNISCSELLLDFHKFVDADTDVFLCSICFFVKVCIHVNSVNDSYVSTVVYLTRKQLQLLVLIPWQLRRIYFCCMLELQLLKFHQTVKVLKLKEMSVC
jgi:hypothetical protein